MIGRLTRALLVLLGVASLLVAGYQFLLFRRQATVSRQARETTNDAASRLQVLIADLRGAQQGYVAIGQGDAFWTDRVTSLLGSIDGALAELHKSVATDAARSALESAAAASENFRHLDARARDYVQGDRRLLASDLIFADGVEATAAMAAAIDTVRQAERQERDAMLARLDTRQLWLLYAAGGGCLLALLLLAVMPGGTDRRSSSEAAEATERAPVEPAADAPLESRASAGPDRPAPPTPIPQGPNLVGAAELCTDLARVLETRELGSLLARAATLLNARGLILWTADRSGAELRAALSHGYSDRVLARMGTIAREANNATATAYRTGQLQTVPGAAGADGAIVVPLLTPGGCLGVMAAEVRTGADSNESVRALATIIAAQLATLVSSAPPTQNLAQAQ